MAKRSNAGNEDNQRTNRQRLERFGQFDAGHLRHFHIEKDKVRYCLADDAAGSGTVLCRANDRKAGLRLDEGASKAGVQAAHHPR